ncbi:hypothetical protein GGI23_002994 [Coemansia sp. RSA 2559]|nr:hypothetical protein GGI23_002994 [Coemansia sp. RSA 2559]
MLVSPYLTKDTVPKLRKADWDDISRRFGDKSAETLRARYYRRINQLSIRNAGGSIERKPAAADRWSVEEDDALRTAVAMYGEKNWGLVSRFVGTRVAAQCITRWRYLGTPLAGSNLPQLHWRFIFLRMRRQRHLDNSVTSLGAMSRSTVIEEIIEKDYKYGVKGTIGGVSTPGLPVYGRVIREPFSAKEDNMIFRLVRLYGKKWVKITRLLNAAENRNQVEPAQATSDANADSSPRVRPRMEREIYLRYKQLVSKANDADKKKTGRTKIPLREKSIPWTDKEDNELIELVEHQIMHVDGFTSWKQIASRMTNKSRTARQCMGRWTHYIGSHLKRSPFTAEEDEKLWPVAVKYYKLLSTEAEQQQSKKKSQAGSGGLHMHFAVGSVKLGIGFLGIGLAAGRSRPTIALRIRRLLQVMKWLRVEGNIQDPSLHFNLVHGLANTPAKFYISAKTGKAPR